MTCLPADNITAATSMKYFATSYKSFADTSLCTAVDETTGGMASPCCWAPCHKTWQTVWLLVCATAPTPPLWRLLPQLAGYCTDCKLWVFGIIFAGVQLFMSQLPNLVRGRAAAGQAGSAGGQRGKY